MNWFTSTTQPQQHHDCNHQFHHHHDQFSSQDEDGEAQLYHECLKYDWQNDTTTDGLIATEAVVLNGDNAENESPSDNEDLFRYKQQSMDAGAEEQSSNGIFGFSRLTYMEGVRSWSSAGKITCDNLPSSLPVEPLTVSGDTNAEEEGDDDQPPGMVRSTSGSLSSTTSDGDDTMSTTESSDDASTDEASSSNSATNTRPPIKGVSFNERVRVMPIPPISTYTIEQRFRMYANRFELRENKARNKKEYAYDGYDWRMATEEGNMAICPLSGCHRPFSTRIHYPSFISFVATRASLRRIGRLCPLNCRELMPENVFYNPILIGQVTES
eukprot:scaffold14846_cov207-Alexandrium_tamarense.AAC.4